MAKYLTRKAQVAFGQIENTSINGIKDQQGGGIDEWDFNNRARLCRELDEAVRCLNDTNLVDLKGNIIGFEYRDTEVLRRFLNDNRNDKDLKFVLNLRQGESKSTVLHSVIDDIEAVELLLEAGADPSILNKGGKTPLQIAMANGYHSVAGFLLTDEHKELNIELHDILKSTYSISIDDWDKDCWYYKDSEFIVNYKNIEKLKKFLDKHKNNKDLRIVLNLQEEGSGSTILHNPSYLRIKEVVDLLLEAGANPDIEDENRKSVIEYVIDVASAGWGNREKYIESMKFLVAKADLSLRDGNGQTLLHHAAAGQENVVELLLRSVTDTDEEKNLLLKARRDRLLNARDNNGNTPLHCAMEHSGFSNIVELLIEHDADHTIKNNGGDTALHLASHRKDERNLKPFLGQEPDSNIEKLRKELSIDLIKPFLKNNLNIDVENKDGATPLLIASKFGSSDIVKLYLSNGARTSVRDKDGNSALHYAASNQYSDNDAEYNQSFSSYKDCIENYHEIEDNSQIINILIGEGIDAHKDKIDVNVKNNYGHTPLFFAVENRKNSNSELLLENGADINVVDENGFTVFHFAIKQTSFDLLKTLLPKIVEKDEYGSPVADEQGNPIGEIDVEKAKELLGVIDKEGNTLLHHAIKWGCGEEILNFLVEYGVDIDKKNNYGVAPIHIAAKYGNPSQMEFFVKNKADLNVRCGKLSKSVIDNIGKEKELSGDAIDTYINVQDGNVDVSSTVDIKDNTEHKKATAMSIATEGSHSSTVTTILSAGAKPSIEDNRGWLPLHIAIKRACDKDCKKEERQKKYAIIRNLASVSNVEFLMSGIDNKSETYIAKIKNFLKDALGVANNKTVIDKDQFFVKIKNSLKDALKVADDKKVQGKVIKAFRDVMLQVTRDDEEINKILKEAIESKSGEKPPTAPTSEEASAPAFDDDFYNEIGSHIKEPTLYPDLSEELAIADSWFDHWDLQDDHSELQHQREVTAEELEHGWGEEVDNSNEKVNGSTLTWSQTEIKDWSDPKINKALNVRYDEAGKQIDKKEEKEQLSNEVKDGEVKSNKKPHEFRESALNLSLNQRVKQDKFLGMVSKAKDMIELNKIVNKALESGVRLNFSQDNKGTFVSAVIYRAEYLNGIKAEDDRIAGNIICQLILKGGRISDESYGLWTLEKVFDDYKEDMEKAKQEFDRHFNKFKEIAESAISRGKLKNSEIDNTTFYLEYSPDSVIDVVTVTDGAKGLGLNQGNIVKIGKSAVEIKIEDNGKRNYTDISTDISDSDDAVIITFQTSLGELEIRLRSDPKNKDRTIVELNNASSRKILDQLKDEEKKEIGKNCLLGGLPVYDAITQGYFERSGKLQFSEIINPSQDIKAEEIVEVNGRNLMHYNTKGSNNWVDTTQSRPETTRGRG